MRQNIKIYEDLLPTDDRRFYPSFYPISLNEPLKNNFIILESPEDIRKGLLSLVSFGGDDLIAQCIGVALNFQTLHTLRYSDSLYLHDPFFAGYLLHSCSPNAKLDMRDFTLVSLTTIKPFEIITIDYEETEETLYQGFNCLCGGESCRGWIEGFKNKR